ncbi:hypothetical protein DKT68_06750 [Micromonospora acroterricola]|uniref:Uncharacterized protein n=1 Tax=Micromonospora acroterricola TaxID=2202421 RepID=A0A317D8E5_9ACTN|nr:hypothetical protein DKT68_06750 [Micromonospora acroterricola]
MSSGLDESHISGAGAAKTVPPLLSRAASPPPEDVPTDTPFVCRPKRSEASFGLAAASRVRTTSTSVNPRG